ncbi:MAG: hypothetical protein KIT43_12055 [Bauldia sp.]|nr:hypothetical protein [Bauldia sp.]
MARTASRYEERHASILLPAVGIVLAVVVLAAVAFAADDDVPPLYVLAFILAAGCAVVLTFSALTVTVGGLTLEWHFRFGFWRKRILLADIVSATPRRMSWWYGLGIRLTPEGWYYAVRGRDAVMVETRSGKKVILGSRTPERLAEAIRQRMPQRPGPMIDLSPRR